MLKVSAETGESCLWALVDPERALVDPEAAKEWRKFYVVGTGFKMPETGVKLHYLGTFFVAESAMVMLVFHVFEER